MSEGEVVHCVCSHTEGDGMMVQCESCLTWQHGQCLGIDQEGQVPDKYMCSVCQNPPLGRPCVLHTLQVKLTVAGQRNNPKVFMWSEEWEDAGEPGVEEEEEEEEEDTN